MLTKNITKRIELPAEPGEWIEVRQLSWRDLQGAREIRQTNMMKRAVDLGSALRELGNLAADRKDDAPTEQKPADTYDVAYLLHKAVVAWSYGEPVTEEAVDSLDQVTVDVLLAELLPKTTEADQKNGYSSSTAPSKGKGPLVTTG